MKKKSNQFLIITYAICWSMMAVFYLFGGTIKSKGFMFISLVFMITPALITVVIQKYFYKENVAESLQVKFNINIWFLIAIFAPIIISIAAFGTGLLFNGVEYSPDLSGMYERMKEFVDPDKIEQMKLGYATLPMHPFWISVAQAIVAGATINAVFAFGEELGWRGLLQKEYKHMGFWKSNIKIGIIWGIWHAPIILGGYNYPGHPRIGALMMVAFCLLYSPIISFVRIKAKSVIAAAIFHGTINASIGLSFMLLKGGNDLTVGGLGAAGLLVLLVVDIGIYFFGKNINTELSEL